MKNSVAIFLILFYSPFLFSQTIRNVEESDGCSKIIEIEQSLGSDLSVQSKGFLHFQGIHFGRKADIRYICRNGLVKAQHIEMLFQNETVAQKVYQEIQGSLSVKYSEFPSREEAGEEDSWEKVTAWAVKEGTVILLLHKLETGPELTINRVWR